MSNWRKFAASAAIVAAFVANAQTADQRKAVRQSIEATELGTLADKFQRQFEADEQQVLQYLRDNPALKREELKNGKLHYLVRIDAQGQPVYRVARDAAGNQKNRASGQLIKVDSLYPGGSLGVSVTGTGMTAGVWEPSAVPADASGGATHELLLGQATNQTGQIVSTEIANKNHAVHVTGTMIGKDLASRPSARGIAYGGKAHNYDAANDLAEMTAFAASGFLISNHSYGDANTQTANLWKYGAYDTEAKDWDAMLKAAPNYLPFVAAGNEQSSSGNNAAKAGYDIMTGAAAAKNAMAVGAVNGDKTMSDYSNWGPTDDGRVKPEIVAKGTGIDSAQATSDNAYSGSGADSSGTSYASPAAAAAGLLLQQYYNSINGSYMRSSTLKALMLGTAEDLGNPGPDHKFGWGLLDIEKAALTIKKRSPLVATLATSKGSHIEEIAANPAADSTTEITRKVYAKGGVPLVVNIAWIDDEGPEQTAAEGIDPTTSRLVYEFDVMVRQQVPNPVVETWPWVVPGMANRTANATIATGWFQSSGGNFRQVIIANPIADAEYIIVIRKKTGSPAADRSLSLVVTGLVEAAAVAPINGACGSANGAPSLVAPTANLCSAGTATVVTTGVSSFTWSCSSDNGGTTASCSAPHQYTVTASAGANGTLACASPVTGGNTTTCIASPAANFNTQSISGCGGTATGLEVNTHTTGAITADCTVTAAFVAAAPTDGHCGSDNGVPSLVAPSANLCSVGTASAVSSGVTSFTWSCVGTTATASCAAPRQYTVTASAGANGTLNCASPVTAGNSTSCTAAPASGFITQSISGCGGVPSSAGVNSYTTADVTANCIVSATFAAVVVPVNGACGAANGVPSLVAPSANLCSAGTASAVASGTSSFTWSCDGSGGGSSASCAAPHQYTVTASAGVNGALNCVSPVTGGNTTTCTATPASGFDTQSISGCSGSPTGLGVNSYTTGVITANCTVSAVFVASAGPVNGVCGSANGVPSLVAPGANLCATGAASAVSSGSTSFTWSCAGIDGGSAASCTAPRQYSVIAAVAGGTGTLNCVNPVTGGNATTCTASPAVGFSTVSISGCGGTATTAGVNSYTTGVISANCTVTAAFVAAAPNDGQCGSAHTVATATAPSANLCRAGAATAVNSGVNSFTWSCNGETGGTNASCSAPRQYTVTANAGANGTMTCATPVLGGNTSVCTATPATGFDTLNISGCSGTATGQGVNSYTTGAISANCTVTAAFVVKTYAITATASPGAGGSVSCTPNPVNHGGNASCTATANAGYSFTAFSGDCTGATCSLTSVTANKSVVATFTPLGSFSITGTASPIAGGTVTCTPTTVVSGGNAACTATANAGFTFTAFSGDCTGATCNLTNITANKAVVATFAPVQTFSGTTATGTGAASASFTGGGSTCRFDAAATAFIAASVANPAGTYPHGWLRAKLVGCTPGATVRLSVTWPSLTGNYSKYGKTPSSSGASVFYQPANVTTSGNTVSFDVTDGGLGDDDLLADGTINDPSGPLAVTVGATQVVPVPTLSELAIGFLGLLMAAAAFSNRRRVMQRAA